MRRLILAFDMGLGKTIIGCVWAKAFKNTFPSITIFVIAPPSLHEDWQRTAIDATGLVLDNDRKKKKTKSSGKTKQKKGEDEDEYELTITGKRRKKAKKKKAESDSDDDDNEELCNNIDMYIYSWDSISAYKDIILDVSDFVVIADEAHSMQSMETKRTKEALTLMSRKKCRGILLLTGTPMKNGRPSNLFPLLRAVQHPFGDNQKRYEFYFCNGQHKLFRGRETWDVSVLTCDFFINQSFLFFASDIIEIHYALSPDYSLGNWVIQFERTECSYCTAFIPHDERGMFETSSSEA
jgi:SNF2 family DNA or RNA helicase